MKIIIKREKPTFENSMTPTQTVLGWIYVVLHAAVLPVLISLYAAFSPNPVDAGRYNLLYYGIGVLFVLCVMLRYLRRAFDVLLDNLRVCLLCIVVAMMIEYALSTAATLILLLAEPLEELDNPNNAVIMDLAAKNYGLIKGLTIFIAPIVEEVLFRGVVFGSIRPKSRGWAYVVSVAVFALYHVWEYVVAEQDLSQLIYVVQYIPASVALAWAYERSGSIWTSVFFHMGFNALSFTVLNLMERL